MEGEGDGDGGKAEKIREIIAMGGGGKEAETVSKVCAMSAHHPRGPARGPASFYDCFVHHGIRLDRVETGLLVYSLKVPARLTDAHGNLCPGALATLVDVAGGFAIMSSGHPVAVTVNMSIQFLSNAKVDDELEITSRLLKNEGGYSSTSILVKNKSNGELISSCQQLCFRRPTSKI